MTRICQFIVPCLAAFAVPWSCAARPASAETSAQPADNPAPAAEPPAPPAAPPLFGPKVEGGLTADEVAARAASTSHQARARAEESAAARHALDQATAAFIPRLSIIARYSRVSAVDQPSLGNLVVAPESAPEGPLSEETPLGARKLAFPAVLDQYGAGASLEVPLTDYVLRLPQLRAAAAHNARAAELLAQASRLGVAVDARVVYYEWLRARLQTEVARRSLVQAQEHLRDAEAGRASGSASNADVLGVQAQVSSAELLLTRAESAAELRERQLRVLMHDPSGAPYEVGEDLRADPGAGAADRRERDLIAQALERRLEPRALRETSAASRARARTALATELPRISAAGEFLYAQPNPRVFPQQAEFDATWEAGLRLSWTPTEIAGAEALRAAELSRARQFEQESSDLGDAIALEVKQQLLAAREAAAALRTSERGLAAAEEAYRVRRLLFQNGRATSVELTDAETELARAQLQLVGARIDRAIAAARLEHAIGADVRESAPE